MSTRVGHRRAEVSQVHLDLEPLRGPHFVAARFGALQPRHAAVHLEAHPRVNARPGQQAVDIRGVDQGRPRPRPVLEHPVPDVRVGIAKQPCLVGVEAPSELRIVVQQGRRREVPRLQAEGKERWTGPPEAIGVAVGRHTGVGAHADADGEHQDLCLADGGGSGLEGTGPARSLHRSTLEHTEASSHSTKRRWRGRGGSSSSSSSPAKAETASPSPSNRSPSFFAFRYSGMAVLIITAAITG